jgi:hypothetical protein
MTNPITQSGASYRISEPDVIHQMFGREVVAIDLRTGSYYSLSDVAGVAWLRLGAAGATVEQVARTIADQFHVLPERVAQDLAPFLAELLRLELITPCEPAAGSSLPDLPANDGASYAPPALTHYNDLQDLFLLDPVHDVDTAAGWPHPAPGSTTGADTERALVRAARGGDLLRATLDGTTLLVNRDLGVYATLDARGTALWQALEAGPVHLTDPAVCDVLQSAGLVEPAPAVAADAPHLGAGAGITVHRDLEAMMRPWIRTARRPLREQSAQGRQLLDRLDRCFEDTAAGGTVEERTFRIGGALVRVSSIAGQDCQRMLAALAHLAAAVPEAHFADLTIRLWNLTAPPRAPLLADLFQRLRDNWETVCGPRGEVLELQGTTVSAIYNAGPDILSVVDLPRGTAWFLKLDDEPMPYWEIGSPFRFALHRWFASRGSQYIHAAAVGDARGAVLLVGAGGSGKSTTSMLCAAAGMHFAGDDYCLADPGQGWVHSLYGTGKLLGEDDLERFPMLRGRATNPDGFERGGDGKAVVMLTDVWPDRMVSGLPIRAVAIPRITGRPDTTIAPATAAEAIVALLPSTVGQLPEADQGDCDRLAALLRPLPAFTVHLGTAPGGITRAIGSLLG